MPLATVPVPKGPLILASSEFCWPWFASTTREKIFRASLFPHTNSTVQPISLKYDVHQRSC